jgi:hypothetical protein
MVESKGFFRWHPSSRRGIRRNSFFFQIASAWSEFLQICFWGRMIGRVVFSSLLAIMLTALISAQENASILDLCRGFLDGEQCVGGDNRRSRSS